MTTDWRVLSTGVIAMALRSPARQLLFSKGSLTTQLSSCSIICLISVSVSFGEGVEEGLLWWEGWEAALT